MVLMLATWLNVVALLSDHAHGDSCLTEAMALRLSSAQCTLYFFEVKYGIK